MATDHKVRGGSALSAALCKASPSLAKNSPADSATSSDPGASAASGVAAWLASGGAAPSEPQPQQRRRLPFLSCFGGAGGFPHNSAASSLPAVSSSEVGIRPCFYWLEAPVSAEDRACAEANARWLKSDCQDDAVVIEHFGGLPHQTFAGVFDGHGPWGRGAAKFASTRLPQLLASKAAGAGGSERKRLRALREAVLEVDAAMRDMAQTGFDASLSGTTACCALVVGRRVLVASTGDSRCVVARRGPGGLTEVVPLTWDAKPSLPEEQKRIAASGGVVKQLLDECGQRVGAHRVFSRGDDVLPGLAMSRSLGDLYAHSVGVSPEPVLNTHTLGERDLFMILATDGLWDIMANEEAADFVERYRGARDRHVSCAEALTLEAQERWKALHDEAIVDDISCVILHTSGLPPPERDSALPRPLCRAASCNDEANELYAQWRLEKERNPSNHKPMQYFKHLYDDVEQGEEGQAAAAAAAADAADVAGTPPVGDVAALTPSPYPSEDAPQYQHLVAHSAPAAPTMLSMASPPPRAPHLRLQSRGTAEEGSSDGLLRLDDLASSPRSSSIDQQSEEASEHSQRRGTAYTSGAWGGAAGGSTGDISSPLNRRSGSRPIPMARQGNAKETGLAASMPVDSMLRPVRKAYPSSGSMQQYHLSYRSEASLAADTPRSEDSMLRLEHKVRGGMARSLSTHRMPSQPSYASLHHHPSHTSLVTSGRSSTDMYSSNSRRCSVSGLMDERMLASSSPGSPLGSPSGDSLLGAVLSPPLSPAAALPLGGGSGSYRQQLHQQQQQSPGYTRKHSTVANSLAALQQGHVPAALQADLVHRGTHLSRTATDSAALAEAMVAMAEAQSQARAACADPPQQQ